MIELKNINKIYNTNKDEKLYALKDINMNITKGELIILKGESGSGKSTILSLIASLLHPSSGEVIVNDIKVSKLSDDFSSKYRQKNIGFIFQKHNLIYNLSSSDNILIPMIPLNLKEKIIKEKLEDTMNIFNISHKKDILVRNLSGGEQQRIAISRAMINNPDIVLADEPTASLDEKLSLDFIDILKKLQIIGKTIIIATHDPLFFNLDFPNRIINIKNGKIV